MGYQRRVHGHRLILESRSDFFGALFRASMKEACTGHIVLPGVRPEVFRVLLEHLYTGCVDDIEVGNAQDLLELSNFCGVMTMHTACEDFIIQHLEADNVLNTYQVASNVNGERLMA